MTLHNEKHISPVADILVVDDHCEITDLVVEALSDEGYAVRVAHDGLTALTVIDRHPPDLLILDVAMPVMRGDQVVQQLRNAGRHSLPIILMTADRTPERYGELAISDLLRKPFDIGSLLRLVARHVGGAGSFAMARHEQPIKRELGA